MHIVTPIFSGVVDMDPPKVRVDDRPTPWVICARERWIMKYIESYISIIILKNSNTPIIY